MDRSEAADVVMSVFASLDIDPDDLGDDRWLAVLAGEWKRTIPVLVEVEDRHVRISSLFAGVPDERHGEVYELLLHRNARPSPVHFALDDEGDIVLLGQVPLAAFSAAGFDQLLGGVLTMSDETFNAVLRAGFATYIEREQAWRAKNGLPANPVSTAP
ncbi:MAG: YbjN domain-containing protein [Nitriliruptorales bacterium]|nr:YbjN domain-containing protein [Nitriliruptorales bacterium]